MTNRKLSVEKAHDKILTQKQLPYKLLSVESSERAELAYPDELYQIANNSAGEKPEDQSSEDWFLSIIETWTQRGVTAVIWYED